METFINSLSYKNKLMVEDIAIELAKKQRSISVSEFFLKNRHLLGFDNTRKALLTAIKEAVDNSLDACEEMKVAPDIYVAVEAVNENRYKIFVEDNGPGIVKEQIPNVFAKLLYGSKFHTMRQSRGQQGIGISAAAMYGQLTTGKGIKIVSKISPKQPAHYYELHINTSKNEPEILKEGVVDWKKEHGTKIELELEGKYFKGKASVDEYLKLTAIANPHVTITYVDPEKVKIVFKRVTDKIPKEAKAIKPHPYGIELGMLISMLKSSTARTVKSFLTNDFSRVSPRLANEVCKKANVYESARPNSVAAQDIENIFKALKEAKIMAPPTDVLSPIGENLIVEGLKKEVKAEFYVAVSRSPAVYRGNPFQIEVGLAYGGELSQEELVKIYRFANRVPLLHQQSACSITKAIVETAWKNYGISQSKGALPAAPMVIMVHIASVWVPFTSESKEAIAHYPDIVKEIKLSLQDAGRKLASHIRKTVRVREQKEKAQLFEKYIPELAAGLASLSGVAKTNIEKDLNKILKRELPLILEGTNDEDKGKAN